MKVCGSTSPNTEEILALKPKLTSFPVLAASRSSATLKRLGLRSIKLPIRMSGSTTSVNGSGTVIALRSRATPTSESKTIPGLVMFTSRRPK